MASKVYCVFYHYDKYDEFEHSLEKIFRTKLSAEQWIYEQNKQYPNLEYQIEEFELD